MEVSVDTRELVALERRLALAGKATSGNIKKVLQTIGVIVLKKARDFSPMSPSKTQYQSMLVGGKSSRRIFTRGALRNSITSEVFADRVEIGVPSNSQGGSYAEKMHDEKGQSWQNLSIGKQPESTDKYIYKAQEQTEATYMQEVDKLVDKMIASI